MPHLVALLRILLTHTNDPLPSLWWVFARCLHQPFHLHLPAGVSLLVYSFVLLFFFLLLRWHSLQAKQLLGNHYPEILKDDSTAHAQHSGDFTRTHLDRPAVALMNV